MERKHSLTHLLRLPSLIFPSVATIPRRSLVNVRLASWKPWWVLSWHKMPAADFSCSKIRSVTSSSLRSGELSSFSILGVLEEWYLPKRTERKLLRDDKLREKKKIKAPYNIEMLIRMLNIYYITLVNMLKLCDSSVHQSKI